MGEAGEGEAPRESAAGPEAVAAAERAMGAFGGRAGGDGRGVRSVEDMMERYIERAYASELGGMEVRTSGRTPSECSAGIGDGAAALSVLTPATLAAWRCTCPSYGLRPMAYSLYRWCEVGDRHGIPLGGVLAVACQPRST